MRRTMTMPIVLAAVLLLALPAGAAASGPIERIVDAIRRRTSSRSSPTISVARSSGLPVEDQGLCTSRKPATGRSRFTKTDSWGVRSNLGHLAEAICGS
jgi:hypothetical protein